MGLVVIGTTAGGTPEAVVHEKTGLLVPPGDSAALANAILRVANEPALAERMAAAGQEWARETQSFPAFMDRIELLYGRLATGRDHRQPDTPKVPPLGARERASGPRVLVVEDRIPVASRGAGYPRSWALLGMLVSLGYRVTLYPYRDRTRYQPWLQQLETAGVEVASAFWFRSFASRRAGDYDAVIVSRPHNFDGVRRLVRRSFARAAVLYDAEALFFLRDKVKAEVEGVRWRGEREERREIALLREADVILMVSEHEKGIVTAAAPELADRIRIWGHPVSPQPTTTPFRDRKDLLFVGGFQTSPSPNEDAVLGFLRDVLPRVRSRLDCRLHVVGFRATEALHGRATDGVNVVGSVEDLTNWYESSRVFVVPHLYSAGIALKLVEAMGRGLPAVVSDLIARQLGVEDGREVLVGRTPEEYAEKVVALYEDENLWTTIREGGLAFVRSRNDPGTLESDLDVIIKTAIAAARQRTA